MASPTPASAPFPLPPPAAGGVDLLIVAAEHSGDQHAARAVRELRQLQPTARVCALGGPALAAAGAQLLHDLTGQSSIGFQVLRKISFYRALIAEIVRWVGEYRPKAVCFVDSSGLNLRIAAALHARGLSARAGGATKTVYFISPQIWASRAKRRFEMAEHLDGLAVIFPFEPECYADTALPVQFVGHPFVAPDYAAPVRFDPNGPILLLPGSRRGAVARIFPVLLEGYARYRAEGGARNAVAIFPSETIRQTLLAARPPPEVELRAANDPRGAVGAAAVLTSSGTMSLHCALAGIPGAVTYRADPLTYWLGRWLVKVPYLGINNLLLKTPMYPEFLQGDAKAGAFAAQLRECLEVPARLERTQAQARQLRSLLDQPAGVTVGRWLAGHVG